MEAISKSPVLSVGAFGTHVDQFSSGRFGFVGTVPSDLDGKSFDTESEAIEAVFGWVLNNREYVGDIHTEYFKAFSEYANSILTQ